MERELPSGSDAPYNINCMSEGGDVEEGQCASGQQCLSTSFYMGVDYYGKLKIRLLPTRNIYFLQKLKGLVFGGMNPLAGVFSKWSN